MGVLKLTLCKTLYLFSVGKACILGLLSLLGKFAHRFEIFSPDEKNWSRVNYSSVYKICHSTKVFMGKSEKLRL